MENNNYTELEKRIADLENRFNTYNKDVKEGFKLAIFKINEYQWLVKELVKIIGDFEKVRPVMAELTNRDHEFQRKCRDGK